MIKNLYALDSEDAGDSPRRNLRSAGLGREPYFCGSDTLKSEPRSLPSAISLSAPPKTSC